ncbi:MAG TPA: transglutaminase family protein, partial [Burkholderiaceae bacterium]|nr:transglutaminase family protein [Burkholderiaceae bacterium]
HLSGKLGLTDEYLQTGYEDTWYYLWRERRLPVNVDPLDSRLDDEIERARLRRIFRQGLEAEVGYVLPLEREHGGPGLAGARWVTGPWFFRDERMYLFPGDSPMGYRLPLDSLPWVAEGDYPYLHEHDPFAPRGSLPAGQQLRAQYASHAVGGGFAEGGTVAMQAGPQEGEYVFGDGAGRHPRAGGDPGELAGEGLDSRLRGNDGSVGRGAGLSALSAAELARSPQRFESAHWITRTALCVEVRDPRRANGPKAEKVGVESGVMYVFMPPLSQLEDYLDLLAAIEATAAELGVKVVLEGYPPPRDPRLKVLSVTPDPGVIEVNIHPAHNWGELVDHTEFLYDAAWQSRLSTEKFMLDGRHTGTGGGNHMVLGGATPADSPFLRRPDLLASLLVYWHNHPSLSYLFSGLFLGPTSQAPRVDEARNDQVYELEIALAEIERNKAIYGQDMPPWLVDRTLRNVLIDVTGNTHRSEFCIDKLYSPDSATGRLGLLELRAFEMPPHARMSIVQQLLLRTLIARFWKAPYRAPLVRWGSELHDRFLLPTFVQMDFDDVMEDLQRAGYAFDAAWFAPHFEFRFPKVGEITARGVHLTLRNALEPWHVMG